MKNAPSSLSNLKSKVDKLDIDKLVPVPVDLSKLSNAVKNDVVKKDVYNAEIKNIEDKIPDINNLATKTTVNANAKIDKAKGEIPNITNLATNASLNVKVNEDKGEILHIANLATTSALTAVENKIPSISTVVKKIYKKNNEIEKKISTAEFNKVTNKIDIANLVNKTNFDNKLKDIKVKKSLKS